MKQKVSESMGVVKHTENMTNNDKNEFSERDVINKTTSKGQSNGMFFYSLKEFGFRGLDDYNLAPDYLIEIFPSITTL